MLFVPVERRRRSPNALIFARPPRIHHRRRPNRFLPHLPRLPRLRIFARKSLDNLSPPALCIPLDETFDSCTLSFSYSISQSLRRCTSPSPPRSDTPPASSVLASHPPNSSVTKTGDRISRTRTACRSRTSSSTQLWSLSPSSSTCDRRVRS